MSKVWLATIENNQMKMTDYNRALFNDWCKLNNGKQVRIEPVKKPVSEDLRGYYFGAVIPEIRATCDEWKNLNTMEMHEVIKKLFFYFETYNPKTKRTERFGRSIMADNEWNNTFKAMQFLEVLGEYLSQCGREMPNIIEYKGWRDSAKLLK